MIRKPYISKNNQPKEEEPPSIKIPSKGYAIPSGSEVNKVLRRRSTKLLTWFHAVDVEESFCQREFQNMKEFVKDLRKKQYLAFRKNMRLNKPPNQSSERKLSRSLRNGRFNMKSYSRLWKKWEKSKRFKQKGEVWVIYLLLQNQTMIIIYSVSIVEENMLLMLQKGIFPSVQILLISQEGSSHLKFMKNILVTLESQKIPKALEYQKIHSLRSPQTQINSPQSLQCSTKVEFVDDEAFIVSIFEKIIIWDIKRRIFLLYLERYYFFLDIWIFSKKILTINLETINWKLQIEIFF